MLFSPLMNVSRLWKCSRHHRNQNSINRDKKYYCIRTRKLPKCRNCRDTKKKVLLIIFKSLFNLNLINIIN